MELDSRICLECEEALIGRSDKKFCDDGCRNAYNNRKNSDMAKTMREINGALRRNRKILEELSEGPETTVSRDLLFYRGFNPLYHTHQHSTEHGYECYFCYELGYSDLGTGEVIIVRQRL